MGCLWFPVANCSFVVCAGRSLVETSAALPPYLDCQGPTACAQARQRAKHCLSELQAERNELIVELRQLSEGANLGANLDVRHLDWRKP